MTIITPIRVYLFFSLVSLLYLVVLGQTGIDYELLIIAFSIIYFIGWAFYRNPFSPTPFYGFFVLLYTISFPVAVWANTKHFASNDILVLSMACGMTVYLGVAMSELMFDKTAIRFARSVKGRNRAITTGLLEKTSGQLSLVFAFAPIASIYFAANSSASSKSELNTGGVLTGVLPVYFLSFLFVYVSIKYIRQKNISWLVFFVSFFIVIFLINGERDLAVRAVLLATFLVAIMSNKSLAYFYILLIVGIFLVPVSQQLKGVFSYGSMTAISMPSVAELASGEFVAQGRNFNLMMQTETSIKSFYGNMILNDILRFIYISPNSSGSLFGKEILGYNGTVGLGFSLLGELYITGGYLLLLVFGLIIGALLTFCFRMTSVSIYFFYIYGTLVFGCGYALRADFANLLAGIFKLGFLPMLFLYVIVLIRSRRLQAEVTSRRRIQ